MLVEYIPPTLEYHTLLYVFHIGKDERLPVKVRAIQADNADRYGLYIQWGKYYGPGKTLFDTVVQQYKTAIDVGSTLSPPTT